MNRIPGTGAGYTLYISHIGFNNTTTCNMEVLKSMLIAIASSVAPANFGSPRDRREQQFNRERCRCITMTNVFDGRAGDVPTTRADFRRTV